ncbi:MAG: rRNA (adenine1518-N6/adenine1519-N6)-dimethyltransferase [Acidimicrobiaceae bacterium]
MSPLTRRQVAELLERHDLAPSRALGQNFVVDPNTVRRVVRLAGVAPGDHVVEVGAGLGSLTLELAAAGAHVLAIERDRYLIPVLREVLAGAGVTASVDVVEADALTLDWTALLAGRAPWQLVANLPYNVATPLVLDLLDGVPAIDRFLVMVQREVGERLAAVPGTRAYGIPSVKIAYWATAVLAGKVSREVFLPRPKVESVLVRITRRPDGPATTAEPDRLFELVRAGFGQRRKMLRGALGGLVEPEAFARADVRPDARAEELSVEDWGRLADASG